MTFADTKRSRLALAVMLSDAPLMSLVFTVLPPVLPAIAAHFGGGSQGRFVAQMIMTTPSIGLMLAGFVSGWLVDRLGARVVLKVALLCFALFGSAGLYLDNLTLLLASRFLVGFASTTITTATAWLLGSSYDAEIRVKLLGYRNALGSLFGVTSTLLAGPVAEWAGWRMPFAFYLASLAVFFMATGSIPAPQRLPRHLPPGAATAAAAGSVRHLWPVYALTVPMCVILIASATQLSFLLAEEGISRPTVQSWVIGMGSLASLVGGASYGLIRLHFGVRYTFVLLMVLMGVGNFAIGLSQGAPFAALGAGIAGLGSGIATPYLCTLIFDQTTPAIRGRALGLLYSAMFCGDFLNPVVFQAIIPTLGIHGAFLVLGTAVAAAGILGAFTRQPWAEATPRPVVLDT